VPFKSLCPDGVRVPPSPDRVTVVPLESSIKGCRDTEKFVDLHFSQVLSEIVGLKKILASDMTLSRGEQFEHRQK